VLILSYTAKLREVRALTLGTRNSRPPEAAWPREDVGLCGDLARPGLGPADRGASGTLRGAARRRPATVQKLATNVEPYIRADGTKAWSLMRLERQLRPEAYGTRRGGYIDRQQTLAGDT
jgi:hypothetical protein